MSLSTIAGPRRRRPGTRTRLLPCLVLAIAAACGGTESPDGASVWGTAFALRADGAVLYGGRVLRNGGAGVSDDGLVARLEEIGDAMAKEHLAPDSGSGPLIPDEWLVVRAEGDVSFSVLWGFRERCGSLSNPIWKLAFDMREVEGVDRDWLHLARLPASLVLGHGTPGAPRAPMWHMRARSFRAAEEDEPAARVRHVLEIESTGLLLGGDDAALLAACVAEETFDYVAVRCEPTVAWRDVAQVLELLQARPVEFGLALSPRAPTPDGAPTWLRGFEVGAKGRVLYDGHAVREPGKPWAESEVTAKLAAIELAMEKQHFNAEAGTGPRFAGEWLVVRVEDDVRFGDLWPFLESCLSKYAGIGKIAFDVRECAGPSAEWVFVRAYFEDLEKYRGCGGLLAAGPYPRWTVVTDAAEPSRTKHVFDLVEGDLRLEFASAAALWAHPAPHERDWCNLRCGEDVLWRELVPALEHSGAWPFPSRITVPAGGRTLWKQLRNDDE